MLGTAENGLGGSGLDDLASQHDQGPVGDFGHNTHVVRDEEDRHAFLFLQSLDQVEDLALDRHVECGGRLVGNQQARAAGQSHRDHHALPHTAGKLVRVVVEARAGIRDADFFQQAGSFVARIF